MANMSDDLMLEYDLLHFVDDEAAMAHDAQLAGTTPAEPQSLNFLNDFLGNADISLESLEAPHPTVGHDGTNATNFATNKTNEHGGQAADGADDSSTLLDELLINGEELLAELAHDREANEAVNLANDADMHYLTDADDLSSPCPTSEGGATPSSPFLDDFSMLTKMDATMSPMATPVVAMSTPPQHYLALSSSSSHDGSTEEENEDSSDHTEPEEDMEVEAVERGAASEDEATVQHNVDLLEKEAKYLSAQYDYLISRAQSSRAGRQSIKTKRRLRENQEKSAKSSRDNTLLHQLVEKQQSYLDNFRAMLAFAPVNDIRMALMTPIESYIHLGTEFNERRRTILGLREEKLDMTYKYIEEKARGINVDQPYRYSDAFERFGKYYSVHFAVSKYEGVDVSQVVKVVYDQMAGKDDSIIQAMGYLSIRESYDSFKCNFLHQRIVSSLKWSEEFEESMPDLESNSLFLCRFAGDTAVFATDYIDRDDLHPYLSKDRIRKDVSSGVVLTAHVDENGNKSVIMKKFQMAKFHMHPHNLSEKVSSILMNKMPAVSQKVTNLVDRRLLESRDGVAIPSCMAFLDHTLRQHPDQPTPVATET
ncbi:hypothetical protein Poli38472_012338 [Pythium oligandrum]|uniref:Uncharacterized protein n=1 Tax=Pythium oligandrum TaxID=41045 RepID=A0A8K1CP89_PYTOL|nr:hypothetical protein Poli38472_012338 [Pythium oligandrum]|eukprot:TMW67222.1 hypothetical protein Poli38472_012338 [Pythium oligandrum]